jgi:hypothetical protein
VSTHLGGSFDCVSTLMSNAQNGILNKKRFKKKEKSAKKIVFDVQGADIANQKLKTLGKTSNDKIIGKKMQITTTNKSLVILKVE